MRKYQKAAVVVAMLGSVSFLGAGVSQAHGHDGPSLNVSGKQENACGNETAQGVLNIGRASVQALNLLANQPVNQNVSFACSNGIGIG